MKVRRKSDSLMHHGIKGQRWGVRRYQNADGSLTSAGRQRYGRVFISGSSKTQDNTSKYYRKSLSKNVIDKIDKHMSENKTILVGDAPGIDRQVQDYLKSKKYKNVEVYGPGNKDVRYQADKSWKKNLIDSNYEEGSKEWLAAKDIAMSDSADEGLAVILDKGGAKATRNNVRRLIEANKNVDVFELSEDNEKLDKWIENIKKITI